MSPARRPIKRAVVLSGGGARGAYEAGVLRYVLEEIPRRLGEPVRFDLVCGTSVGAIHAGYLAGTAAQRRGAGDRLADIWRGFRVNEMLPFTATDLLRLPRRLLGLARLAEELRSERPPDRLYGVLDTQPLERVVLRSIPWRGIRRNVRDGLVEAVSVTATQIATGRAVVFVENRERRVGAWPEKTIVAQPVRLLPVHALASASIPMLFPAVRVGSSYYADGGLRLNTPLMPAMRLGADRILVISLTHDPTEAELAERTEKAVASYGNPLFLFGKVLNALLLDPVDSDLRRMRLINEILIDGEKAFGDDFLDGINVLSTRERGLPFKVIDDLVIRPSRDLGVLAGEVLEERRAEVRLSAFLRLFLRSMGTTTAEADLVSYLLFDAAYAEPLVELGYADARANEEALVRFFSDAPMREAA